MSDPNKNLILRLKAQIAVAKEVDGDFVYITVGDAKRILKAIDKEVDPMKTHIEIDIDGSDVTICETNASGENYSLHDLNWPSIIDDICGCLHDYLEGLDHEGESDAT